MSKSDILNKLGLEDPFRDFSSQRTPSIWGWNGDRPIFKQLIDEKNPLQIIEVGSWLGMSAYTMVNALKQKSLKSSSIICIDTWLGSEEHWDDPEMRKHLELQHGFPTFYWTFLNNMKQYGLDDSIVPLPLPSQIAARYLQHKGIIADLIYIDGSHQEKDVYEDLTAYWELLTPSGVIFGDDWPWPSISGAVKRFCAERNLDYETQDINWLIRKPYGLPQSQRFSI